MIDDSIFLCWVFTRAHIRKKRNLGSVMHWKEVPGAAIIATNCFGDARDREKIEGVRPVGLRCETS